MREKGKLLTVTEYDVTLCEMGEVQDTKNADLRTSRKDSQRTVSFKLRLSRVVGFNLLKGGEDQWIVFQAKGTDCAKALR